MSNKRSTAGKSGAANRADSKGGSKGQHKAASHGRGKSKHQTWPTPNPKARRVNPLPCFAKPDKNATGLSSDRPRLISRMGAQFMRAPVTCVDGVVVDDEILFEESMFEMREVVGRRISLAFVIEVQFDEKKKTVIVQLMVKDSWGTSPLSKGSRITRLPKDITRHGALRERWSDEYSRQHAVGKRVSLLSGGAFTS